MTRAMAQLKTADREQVWQIAEAHKTRMAQIESEHQRRWQELAAGLEKLPPAVVRTVARGE